MSPPTECRQVQSLLLLDSCDRRLAPDEGDQLERLASEVSRVNIPERAHPKAVDGGHHDH